MLIKIKLKSAFKKQRPILQRGKIVLPNIFTGGNALLGFCSLIAASHENWILASYLILLGAVMDFFDGKIARFFGTTSQIGLQLDSLSDAITFCIAPAFLVYTCHLRKLGFLGFLISAIFFLCGIFRLARFNVINTNLTFFLGLPTTAAASVISCLFLLTKNFNFLGASLFLSLIIISLSYMMISTMHIPSFKPKKFSLYRKNK